MTDDKPSAFYDFPSDAFPLRIVITNAKTNEVLWEIDIPSPGAVDIPALDPTILKRCVVTAANGVEYSMTGGGHA